MARFYASIIGNRGEATRMGSAASGITAHPRGWTLGVRASGYDNPDGYGDTFAVNVTGGSNGGRAEVNAFTASEESDGYLRVALSETFGGSVFYLDRNGDRHTRPHGSDDACVSCVPQAVNA